MMNLSTTRKLVSNSVKKCSFKKYENTDVYGILIRNRTKTDLSSKMLGARLPPYLTKMVSV